MTTVDKEKRLTSEIEGELLNTMAALQRARQAAMRLAPGHGRVVRIKAWLEQVQNELDQIALGN